MEFLEHIARLTLLLPIFLFFLNKGKQPRENWVIFLFVVFLTLQQAIWVLTFTRFPVIPSILSFLNPIITLFFVYFFFRKILVSPINKKIVLICTIAYLILQLVPYFFVIDNSLNSIITTVNTVFILLFCLLYFFEQIRYPKTMFVYTQSSFWSIVGFLVFTAGTFFIFWYNNIVKQSEAFENQYIIIHALIFIIRNVLFSIAFTIKPDKQPLSDGHLSLT